MFPVLSSLEKGEMFNHSALRITKKHEKDENHLVLSLKDKKNGKTYSFDVLEFSKFSTDNSILVTNLKKVESDISNIHDVFIAVCEKTIEKFINLAKLSGSYKLSIFTQDPYIQEILLERKFSIRKTGATVGTGVIASVNF